MSSTNTSHSITIIYLLDMTLEDFTVIVTERFFAVGVYNEICSHRCGSAGKNRKLVLNCQPISLVGQHVTITSPTYLKLREVEVYGSNSSN